MQFFKEGYLRVITPLTIDGVRPRYDQQGRVMTKETELPLSAKKHLERQNQNLPDYLKKKIEVIKADQAAEGNTDTVDTSGPKPGKKRFNQIGTNHLKRW